VKLRTAMASRILLTTVRNSIQNGRRFS
jgi:hypothetical protein